MKKFLLFVAACVALVACNQKEDVAAPVEPGQPVTLTATVDFGQGSKSPVRMVAPNTPIPTSENDEVSFHWEAGDQVIIKNASGSSPFTIIDDSISTDGKSAKFKGTALSDMTSYEVYYGYKNGIDAVQDLPYLKDSIFRPFIQGTSNSTGFTLNQFMPVLKINIVGGLVAAMDPTATLNSIVYKIGANRDVAQTKAQMTLPAGLTMHVNDPIPVYFPVPQTNNGDSVFLCFYHSSTIFNNPIIKGSILNLSQQMNNIIDFQIALAACFAAGTRITMADGSTKAVENIQKGDRVRTFDHEAGRLSEEAVCYVFDNGMEAIPFTLHFASGNTLSIVDKHDLLVESSHKYVVVSQSNAKSYIGQRFYNADKAQWDELTEVTFCANPTKFYTIYSANHINCIANGLLTCPDDIDFNLNIYEMDASLKADPVQLAADRAQYGSWTSADFPELTKDLDAFDALNRNTKIALGKGLVTWERLMQIYEDYK